VIYILDDKAAITDWIYNRDEKVYTFPFVYKNESEIDIRQYILKCSEYFGAEWVSKLKNINTIPSFPATILKIGKTLDNYEFYKDKCCINDENKDMMKEITNHSIKFVENNKNSLGLQIEKYDDLKDFYSVLSEMKCAIHFASRDYFVEFIKKESIRTPDLRIIKNDINNIVEVKWLRTANNALNVQTENIRFQNELSNIVNDNNIGWEIIFYGHPFDSDFKSLTEEIANIIKFNEIPYTFHLVGKNSGIDIKIKLKKDSERITSHHFFDQLYRVKSDLEKAMNQLEIYKKSKGFMDSDSCIALFLHINKFMINLGEKDYVGNEIKIWLKKQNTISKILLFYEAPILLSNGVYSLNDDYSII